MKTSDLAFERPPGLEATGPVERRRGRRDDVRLMVSSPGATTVVPFRTLPEQLRAGDLLVLNRSAAIPASLRARGSFGGFLLNLSTEFGRAVWLAEPRWDPGRPGPLPIAEGERFEAAGLTARWIAAYPGLPRLGFVRLDGDVRAAMSRHGLPIRYGYAAGSFPIESYRAVYADRPGSAEMPSAGRPFTAELLAGLARRGVATADLTLHTGVSSVEIEAEDVSDFPLVPEPFEVPSATVEAIAATRRRRGRVIAVGTTVVRALESALDAGRLAPARGFTRVFVRPERPPVVVDALLTGLHDPRTSHLAMLAAFEGVGRLRADYARAVQDRLLWHEFGDSHLIFRDARAG